MTGGGCITDLQQQAEYTALQAQAKQRSDTLISKGLWEQEKEFASILHQKHLSLWLLSFLGILVTSPDTLCFSIQYDTMHVSYLGLSATGTGKKKLSVSTQQC